MAKIPEDDLQRLAESRKMNYHDWSNPKPNWPGPEHQLPYFGGTISQLAKSQ
jgi:hypothetical protein